MAILINLGKRGFVLKEGFLSPGEQITVDQETADRLTKAYPKELKEVAIEPIKVPAKEVKAPKAVEEAVEETAEVEEPKEAEETEETPKPTAKKSSRRKKGK